MTRGVDSKAVVERYLAAAEAADEQTLRHVFAEDASWQLRGDLPISGTWQGRQQIIDGFLATALAYYEPGSVTLEVTNMLADGDQVAIEWTSRARSLRGERYENHCIGVFTIRDRQIQAVREYMDTLYANEVAFSPAIHATNGARR
jgi:uncharacterized protein